MIDLDGNEIVEAVEEAPYKRKRVELFDWLGDLNYEKRYLFDDNSERDFDVFIIRRGLSQHVETVMYANELNKHWRVDKRMAHDFFFYGISKKKRFGKWAKQSADNADDIELMCRHYAVNRNRAIDILKVLTPDEVKAIKEMYVVGGKTK